MATANTHGEDHFVIMFGGLHVEMTAFKVLGKWLSGSGWTDVLTNASFLIASHLTRTRRAYQITATALHLLQHQGHAKYTTKVADDEEVITIRLKNGHHRCQRRAPNFFIG